jgi:hypothetical protein
MRTLGEGDLGPCAHQECGDPAQVDLAAVAETGYKVGTRLCRRHYEEFAAGEVGREFNLPALPEDAA